MRNHRLSRRPSRRALAVLTLTLLAGLAAGFPAPAAAKTVKPRPDLTVSGLSLTPSQGPAGTKVTVTLTVKNAGPVAVSTTSVAFQLGSTALGTIAVPSIGARSSTRLAATLTIPAVPAATYPVVALADPNNLVSESNEANNSGTTPFVVVQQVGLYYYVAPSGDDANDGSANRPWRTIQHAANQALPGAAINVLPGDYHEAVTSRTSGTATARISFMSSTPWGARISSTGVWSAWLNLASYVDIVDFDVTGDGNIGIQNEGSNVRIVGNRVHDIPGPSCSDGNGGAGIVNSNYSASDSDIIGNVVHHIGDLSRSCNTVHGIYHSNLRGHVWNNIAFRNQGCGITTWHAARDLVIANNLSFENGICGIVVGAGDSPAGSVADGFIVSNNIVVHNHQLGIYESGRTGKNNRYFNNLVYGNPPRFSLKNGNVDLATLVVDPAFVNYHPEGAGDYHLSLQSSAIDAGTSVGAPADDFEATVRPQSATWDIGPYESH